MFYQLYKIIKNNLLNLFLINLFLVKLPPFYFLPFLHSSFFTSHSIARLLTLIIFYFSFYELKRKSLFQLIKEKSTIVFFLIYFLFSTLSIIPAINIQSFFLRYKDIVFSGLFLFIIYRFPNQDKKIIKVLILSTIINFFYQIFMFISPQSFTSFANIFIYEKHLDLVSINLNRSRIFIETYDETIIPLVFLYFNFYKKSAVNLFIYLLLFLISFPALLSNFRSRIVMLFFSFFISFFFLTKKIVREKFVPLTILIISIIISYLILQYYFNFSFVDRFALKSEKEDVKTIIFRLKTMIWSEDIAQSSPFLGVGLGNYYDNIPPQKKYRLSPFNWENKESEIASSNPHNIFALLISETGYPSFLFYLIMICYFAIGDFLILSKKKDKKSIAYIISFWTLFIYALVNPTTTYTYNLLFWMFRALIK